MWDAAAIIGGVSGHRDELGPFSDKGHRRRPEVRVINKYLVIMAFIRIGLKGIGALALLWATVVLLGGFVSELKEDDFWVLTIIAFLQAAGLSDAVGGDRFVFFGQWVITLRSKILSWGGEHHHECTLLPMGRWLKRQLHILVLKAIHITWFIMFSPAAYFAVAGPVICVTLSAIRVAKQDYVSTSGEAISANLKPALNLFYYVSLAHGAIYVLYMIIESAADEDLVEIVSRQHGFSYEVLDGYFHKTKKMCVNNPASTESWNLITYGASLLDSPLPEDYASGGMVLTMLVDQDIPVPIAQLLIRSPRQRIQKLIGTLAWRNPAEQKMRWLAARIVEHLAGDLNLAHFPGALECISSLFDTSCHNNVDQEAHHWRFLIEHSKQSKRRSFVTHLLAHISPHEDKHGRVWKSPPRIIFGIFLDQICKTYCAPRNGGTLVQDSKQRGHGEGTDEDLILPALRILENLAYDGHNCTLIYNTKGLLSKIVAPVSSKKIVEDIKSNSAWAKIVDGSLKVVSRLMGSLGSTGKDMCSLIVDDSDVVENLEAVLGMDMKSGSDIIKLQMRALEVLTQLALHDPATTSVTKTREKLVDRALHIFLTTDWMEDYLKDEKRKIHKPTRSQQNHLSRPSMETYMNDFVNNLSGAEAKEKMLERKHVEKKMKEAKETASWLKKKAGEALARLSSDAEVIKSFTGCNDDDVRRLTELLDSKIKTIKCKISPTDTTEIEIDIGCRISAAVILKNLSNYVKEPTLCKVLEELLPIQAEGSSTITPRCWERVTGCITANRNDIEAPDDGAHDEPSVLQSHIQQSGERRLQAELLSLVAAIRASSNVDYAVVLILQSQQIAVEDFVVRLKKMVENNMYATPACLAIQKLTCEMVTAFLQDDGNVEVIDKHNIVGTLLEASKTMTGLESRMLFAGIDRDCHGVPLKPLSSVLAKNVEDLLTHRKQALGINIAPASVSALQP